MCTERDAGGAVCSCARVAACDGTWMGPFTSPRGSDRRPEGERMARDPGGPGRPLAAKRQQWRGTADRPSASRCDRRSGNGAAGSQRSDRDRNRRHAGAARRPGDPRPRGSRKLDGASREATVRRPPGPVRSRSWVAHEAPAYPSHSRTAPHGGAGETARGQGSRPVISEADALARPSGNCVKGRDCPRRIPDSRACVGWSWLGFRDDG